MGGGRTQGTMDHPMYRVPMRGMGVFLQKIKVQHCCSSMRSRASYKPVLQKAKGILKKIRGGRGSGPDRARGSGSGFLYLRGKKACFQEHLANLSSRRPGLGPLFPGRARGWQVRVGLGTGPFGPGRFEIMHLGIVQLRGLIRGRDTLGSIV